MDIIKSRKNCDEFFITTDILRFHPSLALVFVSFINFIYSSSFLLLSVEEDKTIKIIFFSAVVSFALAMLHSRTVVLAKTSLDKLRSELKSYKRILESDPVNYSDNETLQKVKLVAIENEIFQTKIYLSAMLGLTIKHILINMIVIAACFIEQYSLSLGSLT